MWRKSRLGIYPRAAQAREQWGHILGGPDTSELVVNANLIKDFKKQTERTMNMIKASKKMDEVKRELSPHLVEINKQAQALFKEAGVNFEAHVRDGFVDWELAKLRELITPEVLEKELELEARLEARIDRLLKRLFYLKAAKQTLGLTSKPQDVSDGNRRLALAKG